VSTACAQRADQIVEPASGATGVEEQTRAEALACEQAGHEREGRMRATAIDRAVGDAQAVQTSSGDPRSAAGDVDVDTERAQRTHRRAELCALDRRLQPRIALPQRTEQQRSMRDLAIGRQRDNPA
jgi:hypothetical protein